MKKLAILALALATTIPAYANKPIEVSDFNKFKKDKYGNVPMANFLNKNINGLKIDNCFIHVEKDKNGSISDYDMEYYNLCNDKNSKWLAKKVESSKPNFAKEFVAVEIKIPSPNGGLDYTYVLVNKKTKQVISDHSISFFVELPKYAPKLKFNVNSNKACTAPSKQPIVHFRVPAHEEIVTNAHFGDGSVCLIWNGKRFYSREYVQVEKGM